MEMVREMKGRNLYFLLFTAGTFIVYFAPMRFLFEFAWKDDTFSYIPLVPFVSAFFLYEYRKRIFVEGEGFYLPGGALIVIGILLYLFGMSQATRLARADYLSSVSMSFVFFWIGGLGFFYGPSAWKAAAFPIFFLLFMVPVPRGLLEKIVFFLQVGSTEVSAVFFRATGVPIYRDGFTFHLPGLTIEVAKECSGIRSSLSLLLTGLLAGHLFLKRGWSKATLYLSVVPIAIIKNGIRIVTLGLLGAYVDRRVLESQVHRRGGIPIFLVALLLLGCVLWLLRRMERKTASE